MFDTPILLIIFNRPEITKRVFEAIRQQKPKYFFVAADGPRSDRDDDVEKCKATRDIIKVDWECELHTFFREENRGCGKGPSEAISWFFSHVEEGIIIEDDCVPHKDFFPYCSELLEKYRDNKKIFFIGGTCFQNGIKRGDGSYYFSAGNQGTWGWATWKRAWNKFDYEIGEISEKRFKKVIKGLFINKIQIEYWMEIFTKVKEDRFDDSCWDYQFYFSGWAAGGLAVIPNQNLVQNIGTGQDATHTNGEYDRLLNLPTKGIMPLIHIDNIVQNKKADYFLHKYVIQPYEYGFKGIRRFPFRLNKRIKKIVGKKGSWF